MSFTVPGKVIAFAMLGSVIAALMTIQPIVPGIIFLMVLVAMVKYEGIMKFAIEFYANSITPHGRSSWEIYPAEFLLGMLIENTYLQQYANEVKCIYSLLILITTVCTGDATAKLVFFLLA